MPTDYENIARALLRTPQGSKIIKGLDRFNAVISSESGRQLLAMLGGSGGEALQTAARTASAADRDPARVLLSSLLSTKEGTALASKIVELIGA
ncbi:MAG: hypothetical protein EOM69_04885 [Clostridia bacterium]|nr:hypothetical protein [Clostridia bacterium]